MIEIAATAIQAIEEHARDAFPEECCGFLLGHGGERKRIAEALRDQLAQIQQLVALYTHEPAYPLAAQHVAAAIADLSTVTKPAA